jgi:leucyl aminopeptidase
MSSVEVSFRRGAPGDTGADTRVVGVFDGDAPEDAAARDLLDSGEARTAPRKVAVTHEEAGDGPRRRVVVVGLGKREDFDAEGARVAAAAAAKRAGEIGSRSLSWALPDADGDAAGALVEGTLLALYRFDRFKSSSGDDEEPARVGSLELSGNGDVAGDVERGRVVAEAQNAARDLQNLPSNVATPEYLAERAEEVARRHEALSFEALDREAIVNLGMGAFASVAQGTYAEPRLIVLRYRGDGEGPHLGFVGKAVTFDTGGISIKPAGKMHEMKFDMSGGAAVICAMDAIASLGLPGHITAVVPATENMPSGRSVKPGDIVTAMNGKTIEVNNTDAEGRLILADALAYAVDQGAERIVDLATLTGAIIAALGSTYAGLFSNDDDWLAEVQAACEATGELGWRMPLHPEIFELTKGRYADLTNASEQRKAMSSYAAEFLRQFVDERPWVHLDIAGTAWGMTRPYVGSGASGFGVRLLVELVRRTGGATPA